ncbi:transport permease protein [Agromyces sp. NBRC 114283]|uniref:Transport permease protein n=1 Tax=Agromyces mediolanus TaxID=41986 RepID=A0A918FFB1_AGRME|nr:transport permease protein [Agromyces mediolanus]GLJ74128.1 transport permease protein [Agromyces mediolanus]GLU90633.1 transport permease protein [Agromyces sp. NBRC 114283]
MRARVTDWRASPSTIVRVTRSTPAEDLSGFSVPGAGRGILDVFRYRYLLRLLIRKGTQTRYHGSVLGWTWSYVKPAAQFAIFYVVLGVFLDLNRGIEGFPIYLFSGIIVINLFNEAFGNATKSIVNNAPLVKKIYLPRELFPVADVFIAFVHFLPQLAILLVVVLLNGWAPTAVQIAGVFVALILVLVLALGLGLLFGSVNVSFRDAQNVVEIILLFSTWSAPVLYSFTLVRDKLPQWLFELYMANPLTSAVELFHSAFWYPTTVTSPERPENLWLLATVGMVIAALFLLIGQLVFRKFEGRFAQDL